MKIQCQSCQAKYTIADEKVLGKVVKIRCKKCSSTIVINGNDQAAAADDHGDTNVFDYASNANEQWTVNVADGDQRTMTVHEIVTEYKAGVVNDETYCWKDGMADWLPLREIEQLYSATKIAPRPSLEDISLSPQSVPPAGGGAPLFSGSDVAGALDSPFAGANGNGNGNGAALFGGGAEAAAAAPTAAAARRGGGRGQGADLFGNVERAGGEEDVMTSAAAGAAAASATAASSEKMTGQRNENSVLFSLNALTEKKDLPATNRTTAAADGSGLIDIRALSANMSEDGKKDTNARVDDIMNLSGGGAFGAALAAPILAPPPLEAIDLGGGTAAPAKSGKMIFAGIIGGALILAVGIIVAVVLTRPTVPPTATLPSGLPNEALSGAPMAMGSSTGAVAMNDTPPPSEKGSTPAPPGTGADTATKPANVNAGAKPAAGGGGGGAAKPAAAAGGHEEKPAAPAEPAKPASPPSLAEAMGAAAKPTAAPAGGGGGGGGSSAPFDRGAASAAIGGVNVQSCKKPDGPTGAGHVTITFAPDGSVSSAVIDSGPFPGTAVGGCIAGKYRGAHVPAFGGAPVKVGKSFTLN